MQYTLIIITLGQIIYIFHGYKDGLDKDGLVHNTYISAYSAD